MATARMGDHKVHKGHVVARGGGIDLVHTTINQNDLDFIIVINVQEDCSKMFAILSNHTTSLSKKGQKGGYLPTYWATWTLTKSH
jgi:hypothetical protein